VVGAGSIEQRSSRHARRSARVRAAGACGLAAGPCGLAAGANLATRTDRVVVGQYAIVDGASLKLRGMNRSPWSDETYDIANWYIEE
jgi:hypothetical protein